MAESVAAITGMVGCSDQEARRWLKVKNNDADAVVNAIFDGEDLEQAEKSGGNTWNESDFNADRDGGATFGPQFKAFNEQNLHPLGHSAAPTRGNSPAPSLRQAPDRDDEDAQLQEAIAASQQVQSGRVSPSSNFKPATRGHYDPANWSMATISGIDSQQASEIIPDLEPHDRKNQPGEPRFLKQLPCSDYLPNLLTIAHSIPMARRALLTRAKSYSSYGSDSEWWKGHSIRLPRIVSTVDGAPMEPATTERDEIVAEMQRLMALLDESSRSYGSADALVRLSQPSSSISGTLLDKVLQSWEDASVHHVPEESSNNEAFVFHSLIGTTSPDGLNSPDMWLLPLSVTIGSEAPPVDLVQVMDDTLWDTDVDDAAFCDNFMEHCASVLPMHLTQTNSAKDTLSVIVPPVLYVDKYLKENVDATRHVRKHMAQSKRKIEKIESVQFRLKNYNHAQKGYLDTSLLMKHAVNYFSGESRNTLIEEREGAGAGGDMDDIPLPSEHHQVISEQLKAVCNEIESKLQALEQEKDKARKALAQLSQQTPPELSPSSLKHRYTLRGVSTKPHITYVLRPRDPADNDMVDDEDAPEGMQWWRMEYDVQVSGAKVMKTKSTQDDVIRAVELEHNQALLVYASEEAIAHDIQSDLSPALKQFIQHDNENFNAELHISGYGDANVYPASYASHNEQRRGSNDSTIANFDNDEDPPAYEPPTYKAEYGHIAANINHNQDNKDMDMEGRDSPPAHEIRLEHDEETQAAEKEEGASEMIEKAHAPSSPSLLHRSDKPSSSSALAVNDDVMPDIKVQGEEVDLIGFED